MIEFKTIAIENFGCIKLAEFSLTRQGLVLVLGENNDTTAADSNGSGKSTLFKALSWVLFGKTVDGIKGEEVIRAGQKLAMVELKFSINDTEYMVVRYKGVSKPETLRLGYRDGKSLGTRTLKDNQELLEKLLGLDWLAFKNTVLYGQGDILHFADPRTTDTQRKVVLSKILRLERLESARCVARDKKASASGVVARLDGEIAVLTGQLEAIDTNELKAAAKHWDSEREAKLSRIDVLLAEVSGELDTALKTARLLKEYEQRAEDIAGILAECKEAHDSYQELKDSVNDVDRQLIKLGRDHRAADQKLDEKSKIIMGLEAGECPICGAPASGTHAKMRIAEFKTELVVLLEQRNQIIQTEESTREQRNGIAQQLSELDRDAFIERNEWAARANSIADAIAELRIKASRVDDLNNRKMTLTMDREQIAAEENPYRRQLKEQCKRSVEIKKEIDTKTSLMQAAKRDSELYDFWVKGFGPGGLPSYLLDSVVPVVTERANYYLEILSDGDLRVQLDTLTTLKGGSTRDKLEITTTIEGKENVAPSGGQLKKMTLACDLALMDLLANREGLSVNLLLLDEVLDGLDATGRARVMDLLEVLRAQRSTIMVISHDPEIAEKFSKIMMVTKRKGVAKLKAA